MVAWLKPGLGTESRAAMLHHGARFFAIAHQTSQLALATAEAFGIRARAFIRSWPVRISAPLIWRGTAALTGIWLTTLSVAAVTTLLATDIEAEPPQSTASLATRPVEPVETELRATPAARVIPTSSWTRVTRPIAVFGLASPELEGLAIQYDARRHAPGGGRDDMLGYGSFVEDKAHLFLSAYRAGDEARLPGGFFVDLARMASENGLSVLRNTQATGLDTKFGRIEASDAALIKGDRERACIAFRHLSPNPDFRLSGWWCGSPQRPADRAQLTCLLDRLQLLTAGEDRNLRSLFNKAELARQPHCTSSKMAAAGRKVTWLDAEGSAPPLKKAPR